MQRIGRQARPVCRLGEGHAKNFRQQHARFVNKHNTDSLEFVFWVLDLGIFLLPASVEQREEQCWKHRIVLCCGNDDYFAGVSV
jgi:hypothetical protein